LPVEQREEYWHEMAYLKHLHPEDELLRLTRATGYLTQITQGVPMLIAEERERFEKLLTDSVGAIERAHQATQTYYRKLDERLANLPAEIVKGITPEAIAAKITESVRQQFVQTGLPETAQALTVAARQIKQTAGEFDRTAGQLANSYTGTAEQAHRAIDQIRSTINSATNAAQRLNTEFSRDYKWSIATLTTGAFLLGLLLGFVLHWWMNPKAAEVPQPAPAAAVVQPPMPQGNATTTSSKPVRKKRAQPGAPAEAQ
jgi:uncharacterized phage infection (PIP) family protein YhgE